MAVAREARGAAGMLPGGAVPSDIVRGTPIYALHGLEKRFAGTHALKGVDLTFLAGEIHAIVGENGAGKSTHIKLLTGVFPRSAGTMEWLGQPIELSGPIDALDRGINAVHQEVVLCRHLTVAANLFLGVERVRFGLMREAAMRREAQAILDDLGFQIPAGRVLGELTIGQQQLVATARAAARGVKFLIFDEPTAYLTRNETDQLFRLIHRLNDAGVTIIYISHRLEEIFQLAHRVTVLRDGQLISTRQVSETNERQIIADMANRSIEQVYYKEEIARGPVLLSAKGVSGPGFQDISIDIHRGEVVGLYGLVGAGRSEFALSLFGRLPRTSGTVAWEGHPINIRREADAIARGIALVPESRRDQGLCLDLGVGFNLNLAVVEALSPTGLMNRAGETRRAMAQVNDMRIRTPGLGVKALTLSGGNQQKIVVGKWLNHGAELFIFDEPTVGVDVGTKLEIYKLFAALLRRGAGILLISSYLPEVYDLSDRLMVFRAGRVVAAHEHKAVDVETILTEAIGV